MAQPTQDNSSLLESAGKEVKAQVVEETGGSEVVVEARQSDAPASTTPPVAEASPHVAKASSTAGATDAQSSTTPSRPSLVALNSTTSSTTSITPVAPHPKRFSAVNINKKFLEKNTASASPSNASTSSATKAGSTAARPPIQSTSSHSRLVAAKLTANPVVSSSPGGWSRPSSVAPSPGTTTASPISTSPLPSVVVAHPASSAPQLPHAGKVIQPQPRAQLVQSQPTPKESAPVKPVWGNLKPPTSVRSDIAPSDFPTAAEVAHSTNSAMLKQAKADEAKATSETAAKQLRLEEADAFRGIHLDPNAHHWDEMEEDDDNFLDGVIEFGDGRQYKVESSESQQSRLSAEAPLKSGDSTANEPVAKEERFVDDFDRSWPKSRTSPASASRDVTSVASASHSVTPANVSPVVSHAAHSPQDSSRVLFNERSNRLEPYSQSHRPNNAPFNAKRPGFPDVPHSDFKGGAQNIQVLQKPTGADMSRSRRFSNVSNGGGGYTGGSVNGYTGDRNREPHRRDGPPPSPRLPRDLPPHVQDSRDQDRGRRGPGVMGPPPLPPNIGQGGRQLPPHLSQSPTAVINPRLPSRDSRRVQPEPPLSATSPTSAHIIRAQSPAISQKSLVSPAVPEKVLPPLAVPDLDIARKDVMHSAAERAKQRRLQEEAEREAQKERARKKAAELEEKMKAIEAEKEKEKEKERQKENEAAAEAARILQEKEEAREKEAIAVIENAVKHTETLPRPPEQKSSEPVSLRSTPRVGPPAGSPQAPFAQPFERKPSLQRTGSVLSRPPPASVATPTPASETESWRARTAPIPPTTRQIQSRPSTTTNFVAAGPSAAEQVETIANSQDDLEVVDFFDLGTFAGVAEVAESTQVSSTEVSVIPSSNKQSRPVASDFFDAPITLPDEVPASKKADFGAWRRRVSQEMNEPPTIQTPESKKASEPLSTAKDQPQHLEPASSIDSSMVLTKEPLAYIDQSPGHHVVHVSPTNAQRTPRGPLFKEAAMSALNDTMSRIKGALLHAHDPSKDGAEPSIGPEPPTTQIGYAVHQQVASRMPAVNNRWVPPALRPRHPNDPSRTIGLDHDRDEPREVFLVTMSQPPPSPRPDRLSVKFPSISKFVGPIPRKQLLGFSRPPFPARLQDVMTFDPPIYDMNRRDWSLNSVLFGKQPPPGFKGKWKYRVWLPRIRGPHIGVNGVAAKSFVRPTVADGASTWRKASTTKVEAAEAETLDTVSRSPPPEATPPLVTIASIPKSSDNSAAKESEIIPAVKTVTRSQPKMPQGSAVAFVRDSRIDVVQADPRPLVNFIVGSQLDEAKSTTSDNSVAPAVNNPVSAKLGDDVPIFTSIKSESKSSDDMTDSILVTPPSHHSASWARSSISLSLKDSPARAPDPEHLKAVWSQPSNKVGLHPVNSLKGIADDLTGLPFTIQDVKSEDGETPPPSLPNVPSRILPFEVSRAFQQVPTSSAPTNQPSNRPNFSPPSTQAPVARPATATTTTSASPPYQYPPASPANMRPPYVTYPSPMMSHPPGSIVYGHPMTSSPVQRRMQVNAGHTPLYSQPMWMTMPGTPQGMRPVPSPYPAQIMAYPSPGYPHMPQPLPNMMPGTPQGQNGGRGRGMPVMSPNMSHAHPQPVQSMQPMYGGSPVVIHAVPVPQNHGYMAMPGTGRGQPQNGQMPSPASLPQQSPQHTLHPQPPNGFNPGSTPPFARPSW